MAAVVKEEDIALAGQSAGDHVHMMLADDLADVLQILAGFKIRPDAPNDVTGLAVDDEGGVEDTHIRNDIVRMKTLIAGIVPFIRPQIIDVVAVRLFDIPKPLHRLQRRRELLVDRLAHCLDA